MDKALAAEILTALPSYHSEPLRLSQAEINLPEIVVTEFFDHYHLPDIRVFLKNWRDKAMRAGGDPQDVVSVYEHVEKLIEAVWLLHKVRN